MVHFFYADFISLFKREALRDFIVLFLQVWSGVLADKFWWDSKTALKNPELPGVEAAPSVIFLAL